MNSETPQIEKCLTDQGFQLGVCGCAEHSCGMPNMPAARVMPTYSPVHGAHAILVTADEVLQMVCHYPFNFRDWQVFKRTAHKNRRVLKRILTKGPRQAAARLLEGQVGRCRDERK